MTTKGKQTYVVDEKATAALAQLTSTDDDSSEFSFAGVSYDTLGRLVAECSRHRLLVSCYLSGDGGSFNISLRAGDKKRAYQYYTTDELESGCAAIMKTLSGSLKAVK